MQTRRLWISLIGIVVVSLALLANELRQGHTPALGLDLQGGVSVILEPTESVSDAELETVSDIVRDSVDSLGIAEPDVRVEGQTIAVDLPGVKDQQEALDLTQVTGEVSLHPVLSCSPTGFPDESTSSTSTTVAGSGPTTTSAAPGSTTATSGPRRSTTTAIDSTSPAVTSTTAAASGLLRPASAPTSAPGTPSATTAPGTTPPASTTPGSTVPGSSTPGSTVPGATGREYPIARPDGTLIVGNRAGGECIVGPSGGSGEVFTRQGASAVIVNGAWTVEAGIADSATWNALASQCYAGTPGVCPAVGVSDDGTPRGQLAIVLDGVAQSAPTVNAPSFEDVVTISGNFSESEARYLAGVLNRGAYPFEVQPATVLTVSPSLGTDSLEATLLAGAVGVLLVMIFMFFYYRSLAWVILAGLTLSGVIIYALTAFLSEQRNLALTLSGAAGIIVSIGVTVDSYVVFFERLKDEVRHGRTLRNSAQRGFNSAWRTIVNANVTALIGALVLFWLSVGSVRGFAFFLVVSTIIDLVVSWFFTRPAVLLLAQSGRYSSRVLGVDSTKLAAEPA